MEVERRLAGAPVSRLGFEKTPSPNEEASRVELDLAALDIHGDGGCRMMVEGARACKKAEEAGKKCEKRLQQVSQELIDWLKTQQPAPPVLPRLRSKTYQTQVQRDAVRDAIEAVQWMRDLEWDILRQHSTYGRAYAWTCDCDYDEDEV